MRGREGEGRGDWEGKGELWYSHIRQTLASVSECSTSFALSISWELRIGRSLSASSWMKSATVTVFRSHFNIEAIFFSVSWKEEERKCCEQGKQRKQ